MLAIFCVFIESESQNIYEENRHFKCSHTLLFAVLVLIHINLVLQFIY